MRRHRRYSLEFKREIVRAHLAGETVYGLAKQHDLDTKLIRVWIGKHESGEFDEEVEAIRTAQEYQAKVAQLERKVGQLTMELDFLKGALAQARSTSGGPTSIVAGPAAFPSDGRAD